tara:strand:+ start:203 stop:571 length:369 start_codon:yes stop_codon:yes gene_type:complete
MKNKSKGLGDTIDKFTEKTGIKKIVKAIAGDDCGCEDRKRKLNQLFPNFKNIRQFTEDEIKIYEEAILPVVERGHLLKEEKPIVDALYRGVFGSNPQWKSCAPCNKKIITNLYKVYEKSCKV